MTSYLVRATFLVLVVLTISAQFHRHKESVAQEVPSTLEQNIRALGLNITPSDMPQTLNLSAPGCGQSIVLTKVLLNGAGSATARYRWAQPGEARFIYLGFVGQRPDWLQMVARWGIWTVLHVLGIYDRSAPKEVLLLTFPASCRELDDYDWAVLSPWN